MINELNLKVIKEFKTKVLVCNEDIKESFFLDKEMLNEAQSLAPLYHRTNPATAIKIIDTNYFRAMPSTGVCFTRDKNYVIGVYDGNNNPANAQFASVIFICNQQKLQSDYKMTPVQETGYTKTLNRNEAEERIMEDIKPLTRYVDFIDVDERFLDVFKPQFLKELKEKDYLYNNYKTLNKKNFIKMMKETHFKYNLIIELMHKADELGLPFGRNLTNFIKYFADNLNLKGQDFKEEKKVKSGFKKFNKKAVKLEVKKAKADAKITGSPNPNRSRMTDIKTVVEPFFKENNISVVKDDDFRFNGVLNYKDFMILYLVDDNNITITISCPKTPNPIITSKFNFISKSGIAHATSDIYNDSLEQIDTKLKQSYHNVIKLIDELEADDTVVEIEVDYTKSLNPDVNSRGNKIQELEKLGFIQPPNSFFYFRYTKEYKCADEKLKIDVSAEPDLFKFVIDVMSDNGDVEGEIETYLRNNGFEGKYGTLRYILDLDNNDIKGISLGVNRLLKIVNKIDNTMKAYAKGKPIYSDDDEDVDKNDTLKALVPNLNMESTGNTVPKLEKAGFKKPQLISTCIRYNKFYQIKGEQLQFAVLGEPSGNYLYTTIAPHDLLNTETKDLIRALGFDKEFEYEVSIESTEKDLQKELPKFLNKILKADEIISNQLKFNGESPFQVYIKKYEKHLNSKLPSNTKVTITDTIMTGGCHYKIGDFKISITYTLSDGGNFDFKAYLGDLMDDPSIMNLAKMYFMTRVNKPNTSYYEFSLEGFNFNGVANVQKPFVFIEQVDNLKTYIESLELAEEPTIETPKDLPKKEEPVQEPEDIQNSEQAEKIAKRKRSNSDILRLAELKFKKTGNAEWDESLERMLAYVKKNQKVLNADPDFNSFFIDIPRELKKYKLDRPALLLTCYNTDASPSDLKKDLIYQKFYKSKALSIVRHWWKTTDPDGFRCWACVFYDAKVVSKYKIKLIKECIDSELYLSYKGINYLVESLNESEVQLNKDGVILNIPLDVLNLADMEII